MISQQVDQVKSNTHGRKVLEANDFSLNRRYQALCRPRRGWFGGLAVYEYPKGVHPTARPSFLFIPVQGLNLEETLISPLPFLAS
jgi:hypothetical protein